MAVTVGEDVYISVEDANAYCTKLGKTWSGTDAAKEAALVQATQYLDSNFRWVGRIEDTDQLLGWPRVSAYDNEGRPLTDIPTKVAHACAELAVLALGGSLTPMALADVARAKREKIGSVEVEYDLTSKPTYELVVNLLRGIGSFMGNGGMAKVRRA